MAKTNSQEFGQQMQVSEFNLQTALAELERVRVLIDVAEVTHRIDTMLSLRVRDGALSAIDLIFHPAMQIVNDGQDRQLGE